MRTAVVVRAHQTTLKLKSSVELMSTGNSYDFFVTTNETRGVVETFGALKLSHTVEIMRPLGERHVNEDALFHFGDAVFAFLRIALPDYDFFILLEDDVHIPEGSMSLDRLIEAVQVHSPSLDLISSLVRRPDPNWWWYEDGRRRFSALHAIFFPLVGMSANAIDCVWRERIREASEDAKLVFCESFVPSVLAAAGYEMADCNELIPGLYDESSFKVDLPYLLEDSSWQRGAQMFHPVYSAAEYLEKRWRHAKQHRKYREFLHDLEQLQRSIPHHLKVEYASRVGAFTAIEALDKASHIEALLKERP